MRLPTILKLKHQGSRPEENKLWTWAQHHESAPNANRNSCALADFLEWLTKFDPTRPSQPLRAIGTVWLKSTPEMIVNAAVTFSHQTCNLRVWPGHQALHSLVIQILKCPWAFDDRPILVA